MNNHSSTQTTTYGDYTAVAGLGGTATVNVTQQSPSPRKPLQRPARPLYFTDRDRKEELAQLLQALKLGKVVTLCGPGGVGKSTLAAEAIWRLAPDNTPPDAFPDGIIWHDFYREPRATIALEHIISSFYEEPPPDERGAIKDPTNPAKRLLAQRKVLLLLDGAEYADDLERVLSLRNGCGVLITTSDHKHIIGKRLDISPLSTDDAVKLLKACAGEWAEDEPSVREICELVGGLPLAVYLIGHYLTQRQEYAEDYLVWLKETPLAALDRGQRRHESIPLLLEKSLMPVDEAARQALAVVGMLAFAPFDRQVVANVLDMKEAAAGRLLGELVSYSLLVRREDKRYEVSHRLIDTYAEKRLSVSDEIEERFINYYFQQAQEATSDDFFAEIKQSDPHILKALQKAKERSTEKGDLAGQLVIDFVEALDRYWQIHNQYQIQVTWLKEAYECAGILEQSLTQASLARRIGRVLSIQSQLDEALEWMKKAESHLAALESAEANMNRGLMYIHRASIFYQQGGFKAAETDCNKGLELVNETEQPAVVAEGYSLLGSIYDRTDEYAKALEFMQKSRTIWQGLDNRYQIVRVQDNMGNVHLHLGDYKQAREFYKAGLQYWKNFPDQSKLATTLTSFGFANYTLGQAKTMAGLSQDAVTHYEEAERYGQQAVEISQRLGVQRLVVTANINLAWLHIARQNWTQATAYLDKSLQIQQSHQVNHLTESYRAQAEVANGRKEYRQAIALAQSALMKAEVQEDQDEQGAANRVLGQSYRLSGELERAEKYLNSSLTQLEEIQNLFQIAQTWQELALLYQEQGRTDEVQSANSEVRQLLVRMGIIAE